jgi:hypothetical protein
VRIALGGPARHVGYVLLDSGLSWKEVVICWGRQSRTSWWLGVGALLVFGFCSCSLAHCESAPLSRCNHKVRASCAIPDISILIRLLPALVSTRRSTTLPPNPSSPSTLRDMRSTRCPPSLPFSLRSPALAPARPSLSPLSASLLSLARFGISIANSSRCINPKHRSPNVPHISPLPVLRS